MPLSILGRGNNVARVSARSPCVRRTRARRQSVRVSGFCSAPPQSGGYAVGSRPRQVSCAAPEGIELPSVSKRFNASSVIW
jgi:hypothetical protein